MVGVYDDVTGPPLPFVSSRSLQMVSASPKIMDVLGEGIKAVAVGVKGSKPIPESLVAPLIEVLSYLSAVLENTIDGIWYFVF